METDVAQVGSAKKKETSKRNAARKKPQKIVSDFSKSEDEIDIDEDDEDFEVEEIAAAPESGKKGGRKAAGNAKVGKSPTATKKRGPAAKKQQQPQGLGQKLLTEMLRPAESSPQKKVRKMRASPFNRKSVSKFGRAGATQDEEATGSEETSHPPSTSENSEEVLEVIPAKSRPQRANRRLTKYVVSDSESEPSDNSDFNEDEE